jgi:dTDP-glucose pyrophosphorylase
MKTWEQALIGPNIDLRAALATIDRAGTQLVLVVDTDRKLLGTLSDGDVRRALLRGLALSDPVSAAMHTTPTCARSGESRYSMIATMRRLGLHQLPVVDAAGVVVGLEIVHDYLTPPVLNNRVVIMAGGLGSRLEELTRDTPKPMLKVGSRPLLETIVRGFADQGFRKFYLAVNYKAEQIESHFMDGATLGVEIEYLRERERMGTAGALSLIPEPLQEPILVMNADLLTKEDFRHMIERHLESAAAGTMAVRDYEMQVPFGVVRERDGAIERIEEKPIQRFMVAAGIYVLSPEALAHVPRDSYFDMPALFERLAQGGLRTRCHHIDGYWLDIGRMSDYERANIEFSKVFS